MFRHPPLPATPPRAASVRRYSTFQLVWRPQPTPTHHHHQPPPNPAAPSSIRARLQQTNAPISIPTSVSPRPYTVTRPFVAPAARMQDYETVLRGKYPAKAHAKRVADYIRSKVPGASGVLYLEGRQTKMLEDNDEPEPFRQRRFFYYLSGCDLADSRLAYDIATEKLTLFIPPIDPESVIWSGLPVSPQEALEAYDVDAVLFTPDTNAALATLASSSSKPVAAFAIADQVSPDTTFLEFDSTDFSILKEAIEVSRVVKDEYEVALIRKANAVSATAHEAVLRRVRHAKNEQELQAVFLERSVANGAKKQAYSSIVASGTAAATLHYVRNDLPLEGKLNLLLDAGAEWQCYASDITRTFPISGSFSKESRAIYDLVLRMQLETIAMIREGVAWEDVHAHAHNVAIEGLLALGILRGSAADILTSRACVAFFPHGLGHYLGMDTHDTGGNPNYADKDPMFRYLRVRGSLPAGSVITVEPGIYFCKFLIDPYLENPETSKYIDKDVLDKYWEVGGVRIEDNILVTASGHENLTIVPKDADEVEGIIRSS